MGTLLRGISERFNPQIHTEEKSLTVNMAKHFAIKRKTFELFGIQNKFVSFLYATGRVNMGVTANKVMKASGQVHDNAYRIAYKGSLFIPAFCFGKMQMGAIYTADDDMSGLVGDVTYAGGIVTGTVAHNVQGSIAVKHDPANNVFGDKFNQGDVISLGSYEGLRLIVMGTPRKASTNDHYIVDFKVNSANAKWDVTHIVAEELLAETGNRFGEGSERGYQRERRTKWRINYSFISRATLTLTGSAMSQQIAYIYNSDGSNKKGMWEFEAVMDLREKHAVDMELGARYSHSSMDQSSHLWYEDYGTNKLTLAGFNTDYGVVAPVIGDGWMTQLEDSFNITYDPNAALDIELLELFMTVLAQRSPKGSTGNTFIILGDKLAHIKVDKALKALIGFTSEATPTQNTGNVVFDVRTGQKNKVGFTVDKYYYLENEFIFIEDELSNNPAFAPQNGGIVGTGTMYVMNASMVNGVSNIDLLARANRELRAKYIDGMHSLDPKREASNVAFSGFDGARFDLLSEILPIIYSTESCGIIRASAKFTGGALSGFPIAGEKATEWHY